MRIYKLVFLGSETQDTRFEEENSAPDDLIFTDYEGSSHLNSNCNSVGKETYDDDSAELECIPLESSNGSTSNDEIFVIVEKESSRSSPAKDSSLVSNVFIQDVVVNGTDSLATSIIESSPPYPTRRALLRRQQRIRPVISRKQQLQRRIKTSSSDVKPRQQTNALISLEDVAGRSEDTYFALSLVASLERLNARKRATAKLHILQYLTELAFAED